MRETWYVLEDGRTVDPSDVATDEAGALRHSSGVAVAMRGNVPHSRGVDDADAERAKVEAGAKADADAKAKADADSKADADAKAAADASKGGKGKAMKPEDQGGAYKTRETKAD